MDRNISHVVEIERDEEVRRLNVEISRLKLLQALLEKGNENLIEENKMYRRQTKILKTLNTLLLIAVVALMVCVVINFISNV